MGSLGPLCLCTCVRKHTKKIDMEDINTIHVMEHKNWKGLTLCWHNYRSCGDPHHHSATWDNWRKDRALWVLLQINSIQQTLRRYDYLSHTAPLSPTMLIIVLSLERVFLYLSLSPFWYALLSPCIWYHLLSNHQNFYQLHHCWLSEAMVDELHEMMRWRYYK